MGIDPKTEQPTRKLLGHAIRHELDDLAAAAQSQGAEALLGGIYLDQIWDAAEAAERTSLTVLPALILRARKVPARRDDGS